MSNLITLDNPQHYLAEVNMAKGIAEALYKKYPGYVWMVNADNGNNIATIQLGGVTGQHGFYVHLDKLTAGMEQIMRAGGEVLERYKLTRGRRNDTEIGSLVRDFAGRVAHEQ
jgi:hypothetical protein